MWYNQLCSCARVENIMKTNHKVVVLTLFNNPRTQKNDIELKF